MSTYATNILMIALGLILSVPWFVWSQHMQLVYYGEVEPGRWLAYGVVGTLLMAAHMGLAVAGLSLSTKFFQSLLVELGVPMPLERTPMVALSGGFGATISIFIVQWKLHERRFLARINLQLKTCRNCGYALKGLPLRNSAIRCPECGESESAREIVARFRLEKKQAHMIQHEAGIEDESRRNTQD